MLADVGKELASMLDTLHYKQWVICTFFMNRTLFLPIQKTHWITENEENKGPVMQGIRFNSDLHRLSNSFFVVSTLNQLKNKNREKKYRKPIFGFGSDPWRCSGYWCRVRPRKEELYNKRLKIEAWKRYCAGFFFVLVHKGAWSWLSSSFCLYWQLRVLIHHWAWVITSE